MPEPFLQIRLNDFEKNINLRNQLDDDREEKSTGVFDWKLIYSPLDDGKPERFVKFIQKSRM